MRKCWQFVGFSVFCVLATQAAAQLLISPGPALDMGAAPPGQVLETRLTVQNTGSTRFFGDVHLWGGQFWLHRDTCRLPMGLAPGASCQLVLRFSAATACSNYHANVDVSDWSSKQATATVHVTASGGAGAPECDQTRYAESNRWTRVAGPYPGNREYAGTFVTVADLGNDGELDAIVAVVPQTVAPADWYTEKLTQVYVYTYTADGQFIETTSRWFGVSPLMMPGLFAAEVADLNGDGKDDVAFACNNEDGRPPFDAGNVTRLWYTRQYAFVSAPGTAYNVQALGPSVEYGTGLGAADIDGDGDTDLLMSGEMPVPGMPNERGIYMLLNDGHANFTVGQVLPWKMPGNATGHLAWPQFADLDADGDPDLLVGRGRDPGVAVLRNDGGTFTYQRDIAMFPGTYQQSDSTFHVDLGFATAAIEGSVDVDVADMDGDGIQDFVAFASGQLDAQPFLAQYSVVRVARGLGGLEFEPMGGAYDLGQLGGALFTQVLPINGDGAPEVFLRSQGSWQGRVQHKQLRNLGDGRLRYENLLAFPGTDPFPDTIHLADMDRDGRLDVVYTRNGFGGPGERGVMLNRTAPSLTAPLQSLSIGDVLHTEGNAGTTQAQFTVSLSQPALTAVSFDAYTAPGTAAPGLDYQPSAVVGQIIPAGATSTSVSVAVIGDADVEGHETFTVNLANPLDATVGDGQGLGRIANDDLAQLSISDAAVVEGDNGIRTASFVVELSRPMPNPVTFDIGTSNGSAGAGSDYVARNLTGRFLDAGRTRWVFEVGITGDVATEANETFAVTVGNVVGASLADGSAQGTILNDDVASQGSRGRDIHKAGVRRPGPEPHLRR